MDLRLDPSRVQETPGDSFIEKHDCLEIRPRQFSEHQAWMINNPVDSSVVLFLPMYLLSHSNVLVCQEVFIKHLSILDLHTLLPFLCWFLSFWVRGWLYYSKKGSWLVGLYVYYWEGLEMTLWYTSSCTCQEENVSLTLCKENIA